MTIGGWGDGPAARLIEAPALQRGAKIRRVTMGHAEKMAHAEKISAMERTPLQRSSDSEVLLFLQRTLQFHSADAAKEDVFEKLQRLKIALDQQDATLLSWPESPGKDRIRDSLMKAKILLAQIVEGLGPAAGEPAVTGDIEIG